MSDRYDLQIDTGTDAIYIFNLVDSKGEIIRTDGFAARMQIRPYVHSEVVYDELTTSNGRLEFIDEGKLKVVLTNQATDKYTFDKALYDIEVIDRDGKVTRIVEGRVIARHGVTR